MKPKPKTRRVWVYIVEDPDACPMVEMKRSVLARRRILDTDEGFACGPIVSIDVPLPKRKKGEKRG